MRWHKMDHALEPDRQLAQRGRRADRQGLEEVARVVHVGLPSLVRKGAGAKIAVWRPRMNRREILKTGLASFATTTLAPMAAMAQGRYPERPIRLVVPFAPGGATD